MRFGPLIALIMMLWSLPASAESLRVQVDANRVPWGEAIALTITGENLREEPDLSPLEQDFDILRQSSQRSTRLINGRRSTHVLWQLSVVPKREGNVMVPSLRAGSAVSVPLQIEVLSGVENKDVLLELTLDQDRVYAQQQAILSVRVLHRVGLTQAALDDPEFDGVVLHRLEPDRNGIVALDGTEYRYIERRWALFAQTPGEYELAPLLLDATIVSSTTRRVRRRSNALRLRVLPPAMPGAWLPAQDLTLEQQWSGDLDAAQTGRPLERRLRLQARGVSGAQLPELALPPTQEGFKIYRLPPEINTEQGEAGLYGERVEVWQIVPEQSGDFVLPELSLAWWDGAPQRAGLAAQRIQVSGDILLPEDTASTPASRAASTASTPSRTNTTNTVEPVMAGNTPTAGAATPTAELVSSLRLWQAATLLLALLWLLTLAWWWWARPAKPTPPRTAPPKRLQTGTWRQLREAASLRREVQRSLREWGGDDDLLAIAAGTDDAQLSALLRALDRANFSARGAQGATWQDQHSQLLAKHLSAYCERLGRPDAKPAQDPLPAL